jgi:hypothetical protein
MPRQRLHASNAHKAKDYRDRQHGIMQERVKLAAAARDLCRVLRYVAAQGDEDVRVVLCEGDAATIAALAESLYRRATKARDDVFVTTF